MTDKENKGVANEFKLQQRFELSNDIEEYINALHEDIGDDGILTSMDGGVSFTALSLAHFFSRNGIAIDFDDHAKMCGYVISIEDWCKQYGDDFCFLKPIED